MLTDHVHASGIWNAYAAANVVYHCPASGRTFIGSGSSCPDCHASLADLSHWKWYSPDEPHPRELVLRGVHP